MIKVVTSRTEMEGRTEERVSLWSGQTLPTWPENADLDVVGRNMPRVDAIAKVTGRARYTEDCALPGMLVCRVLRSPHAHARIKRIDTSKATSVQGVHGVICYRTVPRMTLANGQVLFDREVRYWGQAVAAVAAETETAAEEGLAAIDVTYDVLPFVVDEKRAAELGQMVEMPGGNPRIYQRGDLHQGEAAADLVVECTFRTPAVLHQCFEPHSSLCSWEDDHLVIWTSTQYINGVADEVASRLGLVKSAVRVISDAIGGGFGSKQMAGEEVYIPAVLARRIGRPVKLVLDRTAESVVNGFREPTVQRIRLGARRNGTLTLIDHKVTVGNGSYGDHLMETVGPSKTLYLCPNVRTEETLVQTNLSPARAFRAPGYTEGTFALESAMDELARRLKLDPLELRRRNEAKVDQSSGEPYTSKPLNEEISLGERVFDWNATKGEPSRPGRLRGRGVAVQIWGGGGGPPAFAWVKIHSDGNAVVMTGSQDIGTGTRTAFAQIAAAELGLSVEDVRVAEGDSLYCPYAPDSGGSQTVASVGPAVRAAAHDAREKLVTVCAQLLKEPVESISIKASQVHHGRDGSKQTPLKDVLRKLGDFVITGQGDRAPNPNDHVINTFGVHFAEVEVDVDTGDVYLLRQLAVHDCGRVISPLQAESQVQGGVTQGTGYALMEELIVDPRSGIVLNPNLEFYCIPTIADAGPIDSRLLGTVDPLDNNLGVKGLGEPPIIPTAPAIANAITDAIGVRVHDLPITRARILVALRRQEQRRA